MYQHHKSNRMYSIVKESQKYREELGLTQYETDEATKSVKLAKMVKIKAKEKIKSSLWKRWESKPLHGQFLKRATAPNIAKEQTNKWLKSASLKPETEGFIVAAQDQALPTNNYKKNVSKTSNNELCRMCKTQKETIDHLIAGCSMIAATEYLKRHNQVARYVHWEVCKHFNITVADKWYDHEPLSVLENEQVNILYDFSIHTDRFIRANRPDIVVKDKKNMRCTLIDVSIPADKNIAIKEHEKITKYKDLEIEMKRMWNVKETQTVPVVVGALGVVSKELNNHISKIPGNVNTDELQKITLLGTSHILRKTLMI